MVNKSARGSKGSTRDVIPYEPCLLPSPYLARDYGQKLSFQPRMPDFLDVCDMFGMRNQAQKIRSNYKTVKRLLAKLSGHAISNG